MHYSKCESDLLTPSQAAEILGCSEKTLRNWRWQGYGPPAVYLSRRMVRYRREDVMAFIDERVHRSTTEAQDVWGAAHGV